MLRIVDYAAVLETARAEGFRPLYHNSGAFGFSPGVVTASVGWVGPDDPTIREAALALVRRVWPPYEANLAEATIRAWRSLLPGKVWVMPKSHWSYELQFGSAAWLPDRLRAVGVDPATLVGRTNAAAIEGDLDDAPALTGLVESLLTELAGSDFAMLFPGRQTVCTLHHHKQVWWTTADEPVGRGLDRIVSPA